MNYRRLVEKNIGRKLTRKEHVHHIDGNPENNDLSNLTVVSPSVHRRIHGRWKFVNGVLVKHCCDCDAVIKDEGNTKLATRCHPCARIERKNKEQSKFYLSVNKSVVSIFGRERIREVCYAAIEKLDGKPIQ